MSEKDNELKTAAKVGDDWDWDQVRKVWERISSIQDHLKRTGMELQWAARGSLFATMQMFLLECEGNVHSMRATIIDLLQLCSVYVSGQVLANMQHAWATKEMEGQKLKPPDMARLKGSIETLEASIKASTIPFLTPEELEAVLEAQDEISTGLTEVSAEYGSDAVVRALIVFVQQYELVAHQGNALSAKAAVADMLHQMWPVAMHNVQRLADAMSEQLKDGPAETRPN